MLLVKDLDGTSQLGAFEVWCDNKCFYPNIHIGCLCDIECKGNYEVLSMFARKNKIVLEIAQPLCGL